MIRCSANLLGLKYALSHPTYVQGNLLSVLDGGRETGVAVPARDGPAELSDLFSILGVLGATLALGSEEADDTGGGVGEGDRKFDPPEEAGEDAGDKNGDGEGEKEADATARLRATIALRGFGATITGGE